MDDRLPNKHISNNLIWKILKARLKLWLKKQVKRVWKFLNKKRYVGDYKKKKAILMIVFLFIDGFIWDGLIDDLKNYDFDNKIVVVNSVGIPLVEEVMATEVLDTPEGDVSYEAFPPEGIKLTGIFSAYSADESQTDSDPLTMASGKKVYQGAIACPSKYEFGTKIVVNGREYTCEDRMNARYRDKEYFDILMSSYEEAIQFGRKQLEFHVIS